MFFTCWEYMNPRNKIFFYLENFSTNTWNELVYLSSKRPSPHRRFEAWFTDSNRRFGSTRFSIEINLILIKNCWREREKKKKRAFFIGLRLVVWLVRDSFLFCLRSIFLFDLSIGDFDWRFKKSEIDRSQLCRTPTLIRRLMVATTRISDRLRVNVSSLSLSIWFYLFWLSLIWIDLSIFLDSRDLFLIPGFAEQPF